MGKILCHVKLFTLLCSIKLKQTTKTRDMKHTPAPWKAIKMAKSGFYEITKKINDDDSLQCDLIIHEGREAEAEANAKLIAAAPELLEALKYAKRFLNDSADKEYIESAINKATI